MGSAIGRVFKDNVYFVALAGSDVDVLYDNILLVKSVTAKNDSFHL